MKTLTLLLASVFAVFAPVKAVLLTTLVLVAADLVTGIIAAKKQKTPITSSGIGRTVSKLFIYEVAVLLGFLAETYMTGAAIPLSKIISAFIALTETTSIIENLNAITGTNLFSSLLTSIGSQNATQTSMTTVVQTLPPPTTPQPPIVP
jgi:phage-related holin